MKILDEGFYRYSSSLLRAETHSIMKMRKDDPPLGFVNFVNEL
jgi:hypothetical protein